MRENRIESGGLEFCATEAEEQIALFQWADFWKRKYPELELLHHVPNGGYRSKKTAIALKAQGVKSGVPDVCLPVARGGYHGLYIEMKAGSNKPTDKQREFIGALIKQDYLAVVCWSWERAKDIITAYLEAEKSTTIEKNKKLEVMKK